MSEAWDVSTEAGFMACYRATFAEVYRRAGILCGSDRPAAEDLVHDVYIAALDKARRGDLTSISVGYLTTAVRHRHIDRWRQREREERRLSLVRAEPEEADDRELPAAMLATLSDRERTAVVLRYVEDLPVAQVAEALSISTRAAESLLARASRRLRGEERRNA